MASQVTGSVDERVCPFCGYRAENEYGILLHLAEIHPEDEEASPFITKDERSSAALLEDTPAGFEYELDFVDCPRKDCGEMILFSELNSHVEMHGNEDDETDDDVQPSKRLKRSPSRSSLGFDTKLPSVLRNLSDSLQADGPKTVPREVAEPSKNDHAKSTWRSILNMPPSRTERIVDGSPVKKPRRRLGRAELGPYAHEKQMPSWLVRLLETDGQPRLKNTMTISGKISKTSIPENHVSGIIPVIDRLLQQDALTDYAYTCHSCVKHISKLRNEGGFCGYRNIQMLTSFINGTQSQGYPYFNGKVPTIFQIQEFIENAWDIGINPHGRIETGGIRGTRKYIGTPEAQTMFYSLDIACGAHYVKSKGGKTKDGSSEPHVSAHRILLDFVEDYFKTGCSTPEMKVRHTDLPPLYFQRPRHSMTIVGFERMKNGAKHILVFDPMFHDSTDTTKLIGTRFSAKRPGDLLNAYRRDEKDLRRFKEFEVLKLTPPKKDAQSELEA